MIKIIHIIQQPGQNQKKQFKTICINLKHNINISESTDKFTQLDLSTKQNSKMHQITLQQLSKHINKRVDSWATPDILRWLELNQVEVDCGKILENCLDGLKIRSMSPPDWMDYGVTKYIARQIVQWLEQEVQEFNEIVSGKNIQQQQPLQWEVDQGQQKKASKKVENQEHFQQFPKYERKIKSYEHLRQENEQDDLKKNDGEAVCKPQSLKDISNSDFEQLEEIKQSCLEQQKEMQKRIVKNSQIQNIDAQSQGKLSQQQQASQQKSISKQRLSSQVTQRRQKKKKKSQKYKNQNASSNPHQNPNPSIKNADSIIKSQILKQKEVLENQSINVSKWMKKKKEDTKLLNQKAKNKNYRDPKIYNYINFDNSNDSKQKSAQVKGISKRVYSSNQICYAKMVSPNQRADYKVPVKNNSILPSSIKSSTPSVSSTPSTALQNPHVKFVTSQFIPYCPPEEGKKVCIYEKKLKLKAVNSQNTVSGSAKIGRLKSNQIVFIDESVSRQHAEIVPLMQMSGKVRFFLKDIGSKFGTFVECKNIQENVEGKSFLIGDTQTQIISAQPSKPITALSAPLNRRLKFDLKVRIDRQKDMFLQNRSIVTIGKRLGNDIKIEDNCDNCKIWYEKDKKVCIQAIQGKLYEKLNQHEHWDIEAHTNSNGEVEVVFGWMKVSLQILEICIICAAKRKDCLCQNQQ